MGAATVILSGTKAVGTLKTPRQALFLFPTAVHLYQPKVRILTWVPYECGLREMDGAFIKLLHNLALRLIGGKIQWESRELSFKWPLVYRHTLSQSLSQTVIDPSISAHIVVSLPCLLFVHPFITNTQIMHLVHKL